MSKGSTMEVTITIPSKAVTYADSHLAAIVREAVARAVLTTPQPEPAPEPVRRRRANG
jgi:hypothetical protein